MRQGWLSTEVFQVTSFPLFCLFCSRYNEDFNTYDICLHFVRPQTPRLNRLQLKKLRSSEAQKYHTRIQTLDDKDKAAKHIMSNQRVTNKARVEISVAMAWQLKSLKGQLFVNSLYRRCGFGKCFTMRCGVTPICTTGSLDLLCMSHSSPTLGCSPLIPFSFSQFLHQFLQSCRIQIYSRF